VSQVLVRFSRRLASWEPGRTVEEIQRSEFRQKDGTVDFRPSVYEIEVGEMVRAFAEHATAFNPPSSNAGISFDGLGGQPQATPGKTGFAFTTAAHREISLKSRAELLELIKLVVATLESRVHRVSRADIVTYARARLAANDREWERAVARAQPGTWVRKLAAA
jgi:hypothetical protein